MHIMLHVGLGVESLVSIKTWINPKFGFKFTSMKPIWGGKKFP